MSGAFSRASNKAGSVVSFSVRVIDPAARVRARAMRRLATQVQPSQSLFRGSLTAGGA
jgi:hypothetical protein